MILRIARATLAAFLLLLVPACKPMREMGRHLVRLSQLRDAIAAQFHEPTVRIAVMNRRHLTVSLINSRLNSLPPEQKREKAHQIARFARDHYPARADLDSVSVTFVIQRTLLLFTSTNVVAQVRFDVGQLDGPLPAPPAPGDGDPVSRPPRSGADAR